MLTIRLQRAGKKNHSNFRVVLAEKTASVSKKFTEILGSYNPHTKDLNIKNPERLNFWIEQHVNISPTVNNLLINKGMLKAEKVKAFKVPKKPAEPVAEAAPAPAAEASVEAPAAEAPAETPANESQA